MEFITLFSSLFFLINHSGALTNNEKHQSTECDTRSYPSSNPRIDRLLASPGPQNDVTSEAPVAPDSKSLAYIRSIYPSIKELQKRTTNRPPESDNTSTQKSAYSSGMEGDRPNRKKFLLPKIISKRSASYDKPIANRWIRYESKKEDNPSDEIQSIFYPAIKIADAGIGHYMVPLAKMNKDVDDFTSVILRPDVGSAEKYDIPSLFSSTKSSEDEYVRRSFPLRFSKSSNKREEKYFSDKSSSKRANKFNVLIPPVEDYINELKQYPMKKENENHFTQFYFSKTPEQENLTPPPRYWQTDRKNIVYPNGFEEGSVFKQQPKAILEPKSPSYEQEKNQNHIETLQDVDKYARAKNIEYHDILRNLQTNIFKDSAELPSNSGYILNKIPLTIGKDMDDQNKKIRKSEKFNSHQIFTDMKDVAQKVLSELDNLNETFHKLYENVLKDERTVFLFPKRDKGSANTDISKWHRKIESQKDISHFSTNKIPQLIDGVDKASLLERLIVSLDKIYKYPYYLENNLENEDNILSHKFSNNINKMNTEKDKKQIQESKTFDKFGIEKYWQPNMEMQTSLTYMPPLNIPLNYIQKVSKLLNDLKSSETKDFPRPLKDIRSMKMSVNQDYMNLPPGLKETIEAGAGMAPGKHEGGGFRVEVNIPS